MIRPPPRPPLFPYTTLFRSTYRCQCPPPPPGGAPRPARALPPPTFVVAADVARNSSPLPTVRRAQKSTRFVLPNPSQWSRAAQDRKSTRLNSSHLVISYAVF